MLGAWMSARWLIKLLSPLFAAGFCQWGIALTTFAGVLLVEELPFFYLKGFETFHPNAAGLLSLQFLLSAGVMTLPTLGLGAMSPIVINGIASGRDDTARSVGRAYALNTAGAIVGSVMAGFWLIPQIGSQRTLLAGIALNALSGLVALLVAMPVSLRLYRIAFSALVVVFSRECQEDYRRTAPV
jgi:spermidine synthase